MKKAIYFLTAAFGLTLVNGLAIACPDDVMHAGDGPKVKNLDSEAPAEDAKSDGQGAKSTKDSKSDDSKKEDSKK